MIHQVQSFNLLHRWVIFQYKKANSALSTSFFKTQYCTLPSINSYLIWNKKCTMTSSLNLHNFRHRFLAWLHCTVRLVILCYELAASLYSMTLKRVKSFVPPPQMAQAGQGSLEMLLWFSGIFTRNLPVFSEQSKNSGTGRV